MVYLNACGVIVKETLERFVKMYKNQYTCDWYRRNEDGTNKKMFQACLNVT